MRSPGAYHRILRVGRWSLSLWHAPGERWHARLATPHVNAAFPAWVRGYNEGHKAGYETAINAREAA